ncbi:MAG: CDC45-like protein [Phormidium sp. OSCR]|nr:MAG: CDC45-like protein [Phormidium sp. OSCR]
MANPLNNGLSFKLCIFVACQVATVSSLPPEVGSTVQNLGSAVVSVVDDRAFRGWLDRFCDRKRDEDDDQQEHESHGELPDSDDGQDEEPADADDTDPNCQDGGEDCPDGKEDDPEIEN